MLRPQGAWSGEGGRRRGDFLSLDPLQSLLSVLDTAMPSTGAFLCTPVIQGCSSAAALSPSPAAGQAGSTICRLRNSELAHQGDK